MGVSSLDNQYTLDETTFIEVVETTPVRILVSVDDQMGADKLYREGLEFDTRAKTDVLTEDMPKQMTKGAVDPSLMKMAEERDY